MEATFNVPELPGREFTGKAARTANSLDPTHARCSSKRISAIRIEH
jgi:hypothetical protein